MNTQEVSDLTGIKPSTCRKYAEILGIEYLGIGRGKIYNWKKNDIDKLKKAIGKRGRPKKDKK